MAEFFAMGGHGFYIWVSYTIVTVVLFYCIAGPWRRLGKLVRDIGKHSESSSRR